MVRPIEDYGLIGDGATAALVSRDGEIDWFCAPRFDSGACFAALLGDEENGRWRIGPSDAGWRVTRAYRRATLVLDTEFARGGNRIRLTDFMPWGSAHPTIIRIVTGLSGTAELRLDLAARFDYGLLPPWQEQPDERTALAVLGPDRLALHASVPLRLHQDRIEAVFTVAPGETRSFILVHSSPIHHLPPPPDPAGALAATEAFWREWVGRASHRSLWPEATETSLVVLRALLHRDTGALIAAPTSSLPEVIGGERNYDYRYCWVRDASFTVSALLNAGYHQEAIAWRDWMLRALGRDVSKLRIMYRLDGGRHINEWQIKWLAGYERSCPVNMGNAAADQEQLDVAGELIEAMNLMRRAGIAPTAHAEAIERALVEQIEATWQDRGHGPWEARGEPHHYTYSKVMTWAGIDRFLRGAAQVSAVEPALLTRLAALRDRIHREICARGYDERRGHFTDRYEGTALDGSLLLLAPVGFLPADDPRMAGTIDAIERELMEGGFVMRQPRSAAPHEGAFLACTLWLADCRAMQGRTASSRALLERVLSVRNDLGLLAEEYDPRRRRLLGNFPQAITHLAVVNTTLGLSGPVLQRAGG